MAYHLEIRQRDENKALVFSKSWSYGEECFGSGKKESKSEKSTHPLKRLKYGIRMEKATNEPFCSVLSSTRRNKKSLADVSHTLQIPPPPFPSPIPRFMDRSAQSSAKTKPAIFHRACYFTVSGEQERFIQHDRRKEQDGILVNKPNLEYDSR